MWDKEGVMIKQEGWQLEGSAPEIYERYLVPGIFGPWAPILIELANLQPGERILDVACGTGLVARLAAQHIGTIGKVTGLDLNSEMVAVARSIPQNVGVPVEWREGDAIAMPFPDGSFEVVLYQLGLQYFSDRLQALREMRRVLVPSGRLVLLVWRSIEHSPGFAAIAEALEQYVSAEAAAVMRAPFVFGDAPEKLRVLIEDAGFHEANIRSDVRMVRFPSPEKLVQYQVAGSPLGRHLAHVDEATRAALVSHVSTAMQSYVNDTGLAFPIQGHLATARR